MSPPRQAPVLERNMSLTVSRDRSDQCR